MFSPHLQPGVPRGALVGAPCGGERRPLGRPGKVADRARGARATQHTVSPSPVVTLQHSGSLQRYKETGSLAPWGSVLQWAVFPGTCEPPTQRAFVDTVRFQSVPHKRPL